MLLISGTIKSEVQLDVLQGKWEEKKLNNDWRKDASLTPEQQMVRQFQDDMEQVRENKKIQAEREAYEHKLRNCRTKEEVERLKTNQMNSYAATAKKTFNNPNIPLSEKYRIACKILGKISGITEAETEFKMSAEYKNLESENDIRAREHAQAELWNCQRPVGEGAGYMDAKRIINKLEHNDNEV